MFLILFSYLISGCNYSNNTSNWRKFSDEIWAKIPAGQKDMFNQLSDEDSTTTYALAYKDWGESVSRDMDNAEPDEKLLNMATSAKHLYLNDDSEFNKTHYMPLVFAKYYKKRYIETQEHEYLDRILVIAYQLRQNREYPPAPISEMKTLIIFLQSLVTSSKKKLTEMGYNKKEMEILLQEMQEKYGELWD